MMTVSNIKKELRAKASPGKAKLLQKYFKTGKGEYAEGDVFLGVVVPDERKIARKYKDLKLEEVLKLLRSKIHEERMTALFILVDKFQSGKDREKIYRLYLKNTKYINNWDLVDLSAPSIVGGYLLKKPKAVLFRLAKSKVLWERRIAVMATFNFIKHGRFEESFEIARMLIGDRHDLIHKAVGWMLREVGKKDLKAEEAFLTKHYRRMPRTMLRYAIEKFPEKKRKWCLNSSII